MEDGRSAAKKRKKTSCVTRVRNDRGARRRGEENCSRGTWEGEGIRWEARGTRREIEGTIYDTWRERREEKKLCTQVCRRRSDVFVGRGRIEGQGRYCEQRVVERKREKEKQHWRRRAIIPARNGERWSVAKIGWRNEEGEYILASKKVRCCEKDGL